MLTYCSHLCELISARSKRSYNNELGLILTEFTKHLNFEMGAEVWCQTELAEIMDY